MLLTAYGAVAGLAYGLLMNLWFWPFTVGLDSSISYVAGAPLAENLARFIAFTLITSLGFDIPRALTTARWWPSPPARCCSRCGGPPARRSSRRWRRSSRRSSTAR